MNSGAYLIIEHTEALHVIDVNSGYKSVSNNQEQNALETNLEAAEEIARQLRLRDLGGIIVVDFIDMKLPENKRKLVEKMEEFMEPDRAKHAVLPISKFGIMQITRQRMKPEMNINTQEVCPSCNGTGKISSTILLEDEIEKNLSLPDHTPAQKPEIGRQSYHVCLPYQGLVLENQDGRMEKEIRPKNKNRSGY